MKKKKIPKSKCENCGKLFDPDQYYFWCNKCGWEREKKCFGWTDVKTNLEAL